jgi:hypothetical protein
MVYLCDTYAILTLYVCYRRGSLLGLMVAPGDAGQLLAGGWLWLAAAGTLVRAALMICYAVRYTMRCCGTQVGAAGGGGAVIFSIADDHLKALTSPSWAPT